MAQKLPSQAVATRYLKAARAAGTEPKELRVEPDGTLRLILTDSSEPKSEADRWFAERETR